MKKFGSLALAVCLLVSCGGTLTHRGVSEGTTVIRPSKSKIWRTEECQAICNQINPDGRCDEWLVPKGSECLKKVQ